MFDWYKDIWYTRRMGFSRFSASAQRILAALCKTIINKVGFGRFGAVLLGWCHNWTTVAAWSTCTFLVRFFWAWRNGGRWCALATARHSPRSEIAPMQAYTRSGHTPPADESTSLYTATMRAGAYSRHCRQSQGEKFHHLVPNSALSSANSDRQSLTTDNTTLIPVWRPYSCQHVHANRSSIICHC